MSLIVSCVCAFAALPLCVVAYIIAENKLHSSLVPSTSNESSEPFVKVADGADDAVCAGGEEKRKVKTRIRVSEVVDKVKTLTLLQRVLLVLAFLTVGIASFAVVEKGLPWIKTARVLLSAEVVMCAAVVDLFTKKIPNFLPLCLTGISLVFFVIEFIWYKDLFYNSVWLCVVAGLIVFFLLFLVSVFTNGGFGMGDSKIITAFTFAGGVSLSLYSVFVGLLLCMVVSIFLLATRMGKLKDQLPFGPFIYLGFVICSVLGGI